MDVPLKFALPLLLVAALPAGLALQRMLPAAPPIVTPAPVRAAPAPNPMRYQDDAALARQAEAAIAEQRARLAAAQAERDRAETELAMMRGQKKPADQFHVDDEQQQHAVAVADRKRVEGARTSCISHGWHCARP